MIPTTTTTQLMLTNEDKRMLNHDNIIIVDHNDDNNYNAGTGADEATPLEADPSATPSSQASGVGQPSFDRRPACRAMVARQDEMVGQLVSQLGRTLKREGGSTAVGAGPRATAMTLRGPRAARGGWAGA